MVLPSGVANIAPLSDLSLAPSPYSEQPAPLLLECLTSFGILLLFCPNHGPGNARVERGRSTKRHVIPTLRSTRGLRN